MGHHTITELNTSIKTTKNDDNTRIHNDTGLNVSTSSTQLYLKYHISEIEHNDKVYTTFIWLVWAGFLVIVVGIIACFTNHITSGVLISASGLLTEFISGIVIVILDKIAKSKLEYYKQLSFDEERKNLLEVIQNLNSEDQKTSLLKELVENYCNRRK